MYLGVDIGGTKTLVAKFDTDGQILAQSKLPSDHDYETFLNHLANEAQALLSPDMKAAVAAVPGLLDREAGKVFALGNLPWRDKSISDDISRALGGLPVSIENDAKLAGLSEARLISNEYKNVLFLTLSTGIGGALIQDGKIVTALRDTEMGKMPLMFEGKITHWEDFAGGRGVVQHAGQMADEITDPAKWQAIGQNVAYGLGAVCSVLQPEAIILGGPVGAHTDQFRQVIIDYLQHNLHPVVRQPRAILAAQRPAEAVVYGCYELARQIYGNAA